MGIVKRGIVDIPVIARCISKYEPDASVVLRKILMWPNSIILTSEDYEFILVIEAQSSLVGTMHFYVKPKARGKKALEFIKDCKRWGKENTSFKYMFNFTNDRKLKLMMPYFGAKRVGEIKGKTVYRTEV